MLITILSVLHVVVSLFLILAVMLQSGNADMGTAFGGSSSSVLGASGGNKFMTRLTAITATIFFVTSLSLAVLGTGSGRSSVVGDIEEPAAAEKTADTAPAVPAAEGAPAAADAKSAEAKPAEAKADVKETAAPSKDGAESKASAPAAEKSKEAPAAPAK